MWIQNLDKKIIMFVAFLLLGTVIAMQARSIFNIKKEKTTAEVRIELYKNQLEEEKKKAEKLKAQITKNEKKKEELIKEFSDDSKINQYWDELGDELQRVRHIAGLTDVKGKGIIIKLDDAPAREIDNPNLLIIHDFDVFGIVNELKKAGAQAISINNERLIATSEQVCAGPNIRINKYRYPVPYEIKAIGDPEQLFEGVEKSENVADMRKFNIKVDIGKSDEIIINRYNYKTDELIKGLEAVD